MDSSSFDVEPLTAFNFHSKVGPENQIVIVEFYAASCVNSKILAPAWEQSAKHLRSTAMVAAIDCDEHKSIAEEFGIRAFPTIKVFGINSLPMDYDGKLDASAIIDWIHSQIADATDNQRGEGDGGSSGESAEYSSAAVVLISAMFEEKVLRSTEPWMIAFVVPGCGECKDLESEWGRAAFFLKGDVNLGVVDCAAEEELATKYKIQAFPTILVFGSDKELPKPYPGLLTAEGIQFFALQLADESSNSPEVAELTVKMQNVFRETQPARQSRGPDADTAVAEGATYGPKEVSQVRQEPYDLPETYEWFPCDIDDPDMLEEIYNFLTHNYVEDDDNMFRFDYSRDFLRWALKPPGFQKSWHVAVREKGGERIVAFITAVPAGIRVVDVSMKMAEINFLCVHKQHRGKRLAPLLFKEVRRRVHLENVWQTVHTSGTLLPTPISEALYWHRPLNPKKLIEVGFSRLGRGMTMEDTIETFKLPQDTVTPGFRPMEPRDVSAVTVLLTKYLSHFALAPDFSEADVAHVMLPRPDVINSFVVEDPTTLEVTDLCSFYTLSNSILGNDTYSSLKAAYAYYTVAARTPLAQLMKDALIIVKSLGYDVFNILNVMDNKQILRDLKFAAGDGNLRYYAHNFEVSMPLDPSELGLLLL